jgi:hypothetical protein
MYVLGGYDDLSLVKFDFNTTQGSWTEVAPMPVAIYAFAACALGSDIFVFGGRSDELGGDQASVFKYDTVADEWNTLAPMPCACSYHSACVLSGLISIVGAGASGREALRFDPVRVVWTTNSPTFDKRDKSASFVLNGSLHAAGGEHGSASVERYDMATDVWTSMELDMLVGRCAFGAVTLRSAVPAKEQLNSDSLIAKASR